MAKEPEPTDEMTDTQRVTALLGYLRSPAGFAKADKLIEVAEYGVQNLRSMRDNAAKLHGIAPLAPPFDPRSSEGAPDALRTSENLRGGPVSIQELADLYQNDKRSPYASLRFKSRESYDVHIKKIVKDMGELKLASIKAPDIKGIYDHWTSNGTRKLTGAHARITMLRGLINFGAQVLGDSECERLMVALHNMQFSIPKPRTVRLTPEQAGLIMEAAPRFSMPSIALAQAFQLDCPELSQKDVIGEYVPDDEPGDSSVRDLEGRKWLRGICWEEIDDDFVLRHPLSISGKKTELKLKNAPNVMAQLQRISWSTERHMFPSSGPVLVREVSGLPWPTSEFRRQWRRIATACGIPPDVRNMDTGRKTGSSADDDSDDEDGEPAPEGIGPRSTSPWPQ